MRGQAVDDAHVVRGRAGGEDEVAEGGAEVEVVDVRVAGRVRVRVGAHLEVVAELEEGERAAVRGEHGALHARRHREDERAEAREGPGDEALGRALDAREVVLLREVELLEGWERDGLQRRGVVDVDRELAETRGGREAADRHGEVRRAAEGPLLEALERLREALDGLRHAAREWVECDAAEVVLHCEWAVGEDEGTEGRASVEDLSEVQDECVADLERDRAVNHDRLDMACETRILSKSRCEGANLGRMAKRDVLVQEGQSDRVPVSTDVRQISFGCEGAGPGRVWPSAGCRIE